MPASFPPPVDRRLDFVSVVFTLMFTVAVFGYLATQPAEPQQEANHVDAR